MAPFASGLDTSGVAPEGTLGFTLGTPCDEFVRDVGTGAAGALRVTTMAGYFTQYMRVVCRKRRVG